jgi:putative transcriptional regulator
MSKLGKRLIRAADEALSIARGEADPSTYRVHVPPRVNVRAIRKRQGLSQFEFASRYGLSIGSLRDWEQDRSQPDGAARILMTVIDKEPEAVARALKREKT